MDELTPFLDRLSGDEKHDPSSYSTLDVLWVLYDRVLARDPDDRFLLSKGHGPAAFYAVLAAKGLIPVDALEGFGSFSSMPGSHPARVLVPAAGIGSGSLGHGLPIAVGAALAGRRVYCLVGDAELDEGSNWEAVQYAGRIALRSLNVVAIDNRSSTYHWPGGIEERFVLEGWSAVRCDGRDHGSIEQAFAAAAGERPHVVVA